MFEGPDDLLAYVKKEGIEMIDVRFCDLIGIMQHFTVRMTAGPKMALANTIEAPQSMMRAPMRLHQLASEPRPSAGSPIETPGAASVPLTR